MDWLINKKEVTVKKEEVVAKIVVPNLNVGLKQFRIDKEIIIIDMIRYNILHTDIILVSYFN